ncbi:MAG: hypothetical protein GXY25_08565 [Pirellulaceae bacterium]|nr:hypothetical protein [Pirellulaceae bacterium]
MNFDTDNMFIAGQDPVAFCRRFLDKISHVHIKDVSASLAESLRGRTRESPSASAPSAMGAMPATSANAWKCSTITASMVY